jgi:hypothetical protein
MSLVHVAPRLHVPGRVRAALLCAAAAHECLSFASELRRQGKVGVLVGALTPGGCGVPYAANLSVA